MSVGEWRTGGEEADSPLRVGPYISTLLSPLISLVSMNFNKFQEQHPWMNSCAWLSPVGHVDYILYVLLRWQEI